MKIIALYKTFEGHEFAQASLESIYNFCDRILFIHSNISWSGEVGNTVIPVIEKWVYLNDEKKKVFQILGDFKTQEEQYKFGFDIIQRHYPDYDYLMLIDTDEVWTQEDLNKLKQELENNQGQHDRFTCRMRTYVKSPFFRVTPIEPCCPTIVVKNGLPFTGIRGDGLPNKKHLDNVFFDHFCYVRKDINSIKKKFITSEIGDKNPSHDWGDWKKNKWDKIPDAIDFHPTRDREYCWKSIIRIGKDQLPLTVQKMENLGDWAK